MINKCQSNLDIWKHLQKRGPIFSPNQSQEMEVSGLHSVITLAAQISNFAPDIPTCESEIFVIIAGAEGLETTYNCEPYYLLNSLLSSSCNWRIMICGAELDKFSMADSEVATRPLQRDGKITIEMVDGYLEEIIEQYGEPHLLCLNHPGFESHATDWFKRDTGVRDSINHDAIVVGCSYGVDEIDSDGFIANVWGYKLSNGMLNKFKQRPIDFCELDPDYKQAKDLYNNGYFDSAGTIWQLEGNGFKYNAELDEALQQSNFAIECVAQYLLEIGKISNPMMVYPHLKSKTSKGTIIRIFGSINLHLEKLYLYEDVTQEIIMEEIEIDVSDFNMSRLDIQFNVLMLIGSVYRDYIM